MEVIQKEKIPSAIHTRLIPEVYLYTKVLIKKGVG